MAIANPNIARRIAAPNAVSRSLNPAISAMPNAVSAAVALLVLAPIGFLLDQSFSTSWDEVQRLLFRDFVGRLLLNTTALVAVGTLACTVLGVTVAWLVERTDLPGRRAWACTGTASIARMTAATVKVFIASILRHTLLQIQTGTG